VSEVGGPRERHPRGLLPRCLSELSEARTPRTCVCPVTHLTGGSGHTGWLRRSDRADGICNRVSAVSGRTAALRRKGTGTARRAGSEPRGRMSKGISQTRSSPARPGSVLVRPRRSGAEMGPRGLAGPSPPAACAGRRRPPRPRLGVLAGMLALGSGSGCRDRARDAAACLPFSDLRHRRGVHGK
jgi:hypothetical protein